MICDKNKQKQAKRNSFICTLFTEMQSVYFGDEADWASGRSLGESYLPAEIQPVYSTALADWATRHSIGESYLSAEILQLESTSLQDNRWGSLTFL